MFDAAGSATRLRTLCGLIGILIVMCGCGQRGALYVPDRNARVVTRPPTASAPDAPSSAPVSVPK